MSLPADFDAHDLELLRVLQEDASTPVNELAEKIGLSQNACWRRIKRLEEKGAIEKKVALLNPELLGVDLIAFMSIRTTDHSEQWYENLAEAVQDMPEVLELYRMTGDTDYLLKIQISNLRAYDKLYKKIIQIAKSGDISTSIAMEKIKSTTAIPLN